MNLAPLVSLIKQAPYYESFRRHLSDATREHALSAPDAGKPYLLAFLYQELKTPILVITAGPKECRRLYDELQIWCPQSVPLFHFPEPDSLPYEDLPVDASTAAIRSQVLSFLLSTESTKPFIVVTSSQAIAHKVQHPESFMGGSWRIETGMKVDPVQLIAGWQAQGYEVEETVEVPGTVARRGGIVDIFSLGSSLPVRFEFFGNQVESIRLFDPETQKSVKKVPSVDIIPAAEISGNGHAPSDIGSLFDYLPQNIILAMDNPDDIKTTLEQLDARAQDLRHSRTDKGELAPDIPTPYLDWSNFWEQACRVNRRLVLWSWSDASDAVSMVQPAFTLAPSFGGKLDLFIKDVKTRMSRKERVIVVSHQSNRLTEVLEEEDVTAPVRTELEEVPPTGALTLIQGSLSEGWVMNGTMTVLTDAEIFGFVKQRRMVKKRPARRQWFLYHLTPGEHVVHVDHGIGKFIGLTTISTQGVTRDYLILEYADGGRLYVPTDQIDRVSRYIGSGGQPPALSRLGTQEWERTKRRIKESVAETAEELVALYAAREVLDGFPFSPDSHWQEELEASFPYLETPDQLQAIKAVKEDMERSRPMDRLVCGDVGYGKTEVALRAAFKAVLDGKQVALLVPTTVLAQQHFNTFKERLQAFPTRIEMLSRFTDKKAQKKIIEELAAGSVDIVIGTHRLLQKDVVFNNLGLAIIDEEQRFGVAHKERLKKMRQEIDVLTLSATPIPRTLHMSLSGIRDMSVMETPPDERLPIKTYVGPYNDRLIREAVLRELERNGQIFFVHNRIRSIELVAQNLKEIVPEARIATAHGRMPEEDLERVMADFADGKYDVLISTTIIESGLDMPNVNTLIVNQSDRLGLSQLYQLRGRVGRGSDRAYAYFFFEKGKRLTDQAEKRLRTIFEATELGAGFGIAMKDLEIRGAGNLLGVEQSGQVSAVGFDLYCRLLAEAVEELKAKRDGEILEKKQSTQPTITLPVTANIPEEYIPNPSTRITLYHRLTEIQRREELRDFASELIDRFGALPGPVLNLLELLEVKLLAAAKNVQSLSIEAGHIVVNLTPGKKFKALPRMPTSGYRLGDGYLKLEMRRLGSGWFKILKMILEQMLVN